MSSGPDTSQAGSSGPGRFRDAALYGYLAAWLFLGLLLAVVFPGKPWMVALPAAAIAVGHLSLLAWRRWAR
jgi:hypothetical protein